MVRRRRRLGDDMADRMADMDAWGLQGLQRTHHLNRLHDYHLDLMCMHLQRPRRTDVVEFWAIVVFVVAAVAAVIWWW